MGGIGRRPQSFSSGKKFREAVDRRNDNDFDDRPLLFPGIEYTTEFSNQRLFQEDLVDYITSKVVRKMCEPKQRERYFLAQYIRYVHISIYIYLPASSFQFLIRENYLGFKLRRRFWPRARAFPCPMRRPLIL